MSSEPSPNLIAEFYMKGGIEIQKNITGKYRLCQKENCEKYVPCPYVKCQEHRTDFGSEIIKSWGE